jgi:hypothetical protein
MRARFETISVFALALLLSPGCLVTSDDDASESSRRGRRR